jgi:hypothetical protein
MHTDISRSAPARSTLPDRAALCVQLEETRVAFHALVESLTEAQWHSKNGHDGMDGLRRASARRGWTGPSARDDRACAPRQELFQSSLMAEVSTQSLARHVERSGSNP